MDSDLYLTLSDFEQIDLAAFEILLAELDGTTPFHQHESGANDSVSDHPPLEQIDEDIYTVEELQAMFDHETGVYDPAESEDDLDFDSYFSFLDDIDRFVAGDGESGLSEEDISRHLKVKTRRNWEDEDAGICAVCLDDLCEKIGMLDCEHEYHDCCIKQWLRKKNLCPLCKKVALPWEDINL